MNTNDLVKCIQLERQDILMAINEYEKIVQKDPLYWEALSRLALLNVRRGNSGNARMLLIQAIKALFSKERNYLGKAFVELKDLERDRFLYDETLDSWEDISSKITLSFIEVFELYLYFIDDINGKDYELNICLNILKQDFFKAGHICNNNSNVLFHDEELNEFIRYYINYFYEFEIQNYWNGGVFISSGKKDDKYLEASDFYINFTTYKNNDKEQSSYYLNKAQSAYESYFEIELKPISEAYLYLGKIYVENKKSTLAIQLLNKYIEIITPIYAIKYHDKLTKNNFLSDAEFHIAKAYYQLDEFENALNRSQKSLELNPFNADVFDLKSDIIFNLGDKKEAKKFLDTSMKLRYKS